MIWTLRGRLGGSVREKKEERKRVGKSNKDRRGRKEEKGGEGSGQACW